MKRSTEVLLFAAALAVATVVPNLNAQDGPKGPRGDRPPRGEMLGARMAKELGLSEDQEKQIKAINESYRPQLEAIREDKSLSRDQKREKSQALNKEREAKVDAVLTPEQRTKAQAMREKMKERMKDRKGHGGPDHDGPPPPPEGK
ncbi:MAG: hypothetical protein KF715_10495 [Candidatus Didemnitutus sp.]|nr:hypothetical protein [Candidatus Didemnitutus sp.]